MKSQAAIACAWCARPFRPRSTGGRKQRFCRSSCRRAFHAAARRWAVDAIDAGGLSVEDIKSGTLQTCTLPQTASAAVPMPTCRPGSSDAELPYTPADAPLPASSRAAPPIIDDIMRRTGVADTAMEAQIKQEVAGSEWEVKRDGAGSKPQRTGHVRLSAALEREWGGEHEVRTYYGTAAAKLLAQRLGKDVAKFLAFAANADAGDIIDLLRSSVTARAAAAARDAIAPDKDEEPSLPFMRRG